MTEKQRVNYGYHTDEGDPPPYALENGKGGKRPLEEEEEEDPWNVTELKQDYTPWEELDSRGKCIRGFLYPVKVVLVLGFLYLFICSLDFLSSSFKLLGGKKAGEVFQNSDILQNPVAGLMMGVLVTVLVQSSSTSTSIIISMVGAEILPPETAVPIVMGANIGTSVTNTIVAMGQITEKDDFRRAFAGATVHDMFNWLSVLVLLPLEVISGYLFKLSSAIVDSMHLNETLDVNQDLLKVITKPFTTLIVQVSSSGIKKIAKGESGVNTLMKFCCDKVKPKDCCGDTLDESDLYDGTRTYKGAERQEVCQVVAGCAKQDYLLPEEATRMSNCTLKPWVKANYTTTHPLNSLHCSLLQGNATETACCNEKWQGSSFFTDSTRNATVAERDALCDTITNDCFGSSAEVLDSCRNSSWVDTRNITREGAKFDCSIWTTDVAKKTCNKQCEFLFREAHVNQGGPLSDEATGGILLVLSLILLCVCLVCIVKLLHSLLRGPMAKVIKKFVNADFPGKCGYFTGYLAILLGAGFTVLVQSSSIFTSTLTPLVGIGVITLDRMYPLTLGSNIGTTFTGILSALAQDTKTIPQSLQVAFCHLFFNISGIILFYPLPFFRPAIPAAKFLGNTTAKYRWFAILYLICMFFAFPALVFALSIVGFWLLGAVLIPIAVVCVVIGVIKCIQHKRKDKLPRKLQDWKFLPRPMRSLEPYDNCMKKLCFCKRFQEDKEEAPRHASNGKGIANGGFDGVVADTSLSTNL